MADPISAALVGAPLASATAGASTVGLVGAAGVFAPTAGTLFSATGLLSAASVVGTGLSIFSSIQGGAQQQASLNFQAQQQEIQARNERIQGIEKQNAARRQMLKTISATNAQYASRGIDVGTGTPFFMEQESLKAGQQDIQSIGRIAGINETQSRVQASQYRSAGKTAFRSGLLEGATAAKGFFQE